MENYSILYHILKKLVLFEYFPYPSINAKLRAIQVQLSSQHKPQDKHCDLPHQAQLPPIS